MSVANRTPSRIGTMTFFWTMMPPSGASGRFIAIGFASPAGRPSRTGAGAGAHDARTSGATTNTARVHTFRLFIQLRSSFVAIPGPADLPWPRAPLPPAPRLQWRSPPGEHAVRRSKDQTREANWGERRGEPTHGVAVRGFTYRSSHRAISHNACPTDSRAR